MSDIWFAETLYPDFQQRLSVSRIIHQEKTDLQELVIFENPRFGRVLALDGVVQTTERDEFCYHEMLAHVPILAHGEAKQVCIIGGGDGGALREVLQHPTVERATMVEIDAGVVELSREYLPTICQDAFDNPRADLVITDGLKFMQETDRIFDVIIVDSTDPIGPSIPLFGDAFYTDCRDHLSDRGILVTQSGVTYMQEHEARDTHARMKSLFADATLYLTQVPTYGAGYMTLGWGCRSEEPRQTPAAEIERRFATSGIKTRYYNPAIHMACFALPGYISRLITA